MSELSFSDAVPPLDVGSEPPPDELVSEEEEDLLEEDALEVFSEDELPEEVLLDEEYLFAYQSFFSIPFVSIYSSGVISS